MPVRHKFIIVFNHVVYRIQLSMFLDFQLSWPPDGFPKRHHNSFLDDSSADLPREVLGTSKPSSSLLDPAYFSRLSRLVKAVFGSLVLVRIISEEFRLNSKSVLAFCRCTWTSFGSARTFFGAASGASGASHTHKHTTLTPLTPVAVEYLKLFPHSQGFLTAKN